MIDTSDFKTGLTIELDGDPCKIVDFQHVNLVKVQHRKNKNKNHENRCFH